MTVRVYPSRLPGEPLETHEHTAMTLHQWFCENVKEYRSDIAAPVVVEINGVSVPLSEWPFCQLQIDSDVRIYPIPYAINAVYAAWVAIAIAVASVAYSLIMMSKMGSGSSSANGDNLDLSPTKANSAKLGAPIREVLGRYRVFPDYLVQPVSRFDKNNPQIYRTSMFLSLGVGNFSINQGDIRIGNTPVSAFGDDVSYTIYPPGADISADSRSENWFASTEIGGTTSGTAGLDLASTGPSSVSISSDAISVSGNAISMIGGTSSNENGSVIPDSWKEGTVITVTAPETFTMATESGRSVIYGDITELAPAIGKRIALTWNNTDYDLYVSAYHAGTPAVPGVGGNAASITGSASPVTYDFSESPVSFTLSWAGVSYVVSLTTNYTTMAGLMDAIEDQLTGSGLSVSSLDTRIRILEPNSPYSGNSISYSLLPVELFGDSPYAVSGVASTGGTPAILPSLSLAYGSADGGAFSGLPTGQQRLSLALRGRQYRIAEIDGLTITVQRLITNNDGSVTPDAKWPGFTPRIILDGMATGLNDATQWMGPFLCCPDSEKTTRVELNFVYPQGLVDIGSKDGKIHWHDVEIMVQYRLSGSGSWTDFRIKHGNNTVNEIGYTETITFPSAGNYEIRVKRITPVWGGTTRDSVQWQSMRAMLSTHPTRYRDITTIALTARTGNRLAAQSDRRVSVTGTRLYGNGLQNRSISGALLHVLTSAGMDTSEIDSAAITALENQYWTPRGERFDFSADSGDISVLDMVQKISNAGMGYFLLSDGLASAGREGIKPWTGIITPHESTEELQTSFSAPSADDYDAVDVTYINGTTWAEETVQCRSPGNPTPVKIEDYRLDGVTDPDRAYRIGMRRLMKYLHQRLGHTVSTELDALCYDYGDRIVLADDIPGSSTISCLIVGVESAGGLVTLNVSESLDWNFTNPRCLIRFQDGSASALLTPTRIDDYTLNLPVTAALRLDEWDMDDGAIEPLRLVFCSSERVGYDALLSSIEPSPDGTTAVNAVQYTPLLYQHDDATYPGDTV